MVLHNYGQIGQNNRKEFKQIYAHFNFIPSLYPVQLIFNNGVKIIQWGKESLFNKWHGKTINAYEKTLILTPASHHIQKLTYDG